MQLFPRFWSLAAMTASAMLGLAAFAAPAGAATAAKTSGGWSAQTAISGVSQPDPTRGRS
jgi:hypothetical protein